MNTEAGQRAQLTSNTSKAVTQAYDSDDSDIEQMTKQGPAKSALNNLFSGKTEGDANDQAQADEEDEDEEYLARINKKQQTKKKGKSTKYQKDKIGTKDAKVLTGGRTVADHTELSKLTAQMSERSKAIKKDKKKSGAKGTSNEITREKVFAKLKKARIAVSTRAINK